MAKSPRVQLVVDGKDNTKQAFGAVSKSLDALEKKTASVGRAMVGAFAGIVSVSTLKQIGQINSEWVDMSSRLRRVTADEEEFASVTERLGEVAESTWTGLNETIESYLSMQGPLADMGYTTQEQLNFVSGLNNALVVSGAKKEVAASVQYALNKAMAAGVLRGQNLNTVIEKGGYVAELLAEELGVTVSELRRLGAEGEITGEVVYNAVGGNFERTGEKAEAMAATVNDAMGRVDESIKAVFRDEELMKPLTESLLELAAVIKDPGTQQGLASLASIMAGTASNAASGATDIGYLNESLSVLGRVLTGDITKIEMLNEEIKQIDRAINKKGRVGRFANFIFGKDSLEQQKAEIIARREAIISEETGTTAEMRAEEEARQAMLKEEKEKENAIQRKYVSDIKEYNAKAVQAVKDRGKELAKAEKDAAKKVADAKKEIADIEKQFDDIRKEMAGGGDKEPSFAEYQSLAAAANRAMASGDTAKAKEDALAAANVLKELAAAGENTYGFAGMVNSMEAIAKSAGAIEQASAEAELVAIQQEIVLLAEKAKELENMPITFALDNESLESAKAQISKALESMKVEAVIPVRVAMADAGGEPPEGFASGGHIKGPGTSTSDSILARLSDGEYVVKAAAVRKYGLQTLHAMNNMNMPKFASGGLVGSVTNMPAQQKNIGTLNFNLPGGDNFSVDVAGTSSLDDLHRAALKFGRTRT